MRKNNIILDFTSLLDVIMIILFILVSTLSQQTIEEKNSIQEQLDKSSEEISALQESNSGLEIEVQLLEDELNKYKAIAGNSEYDKAMLYKNLLSCSTKLTLVCKPFSNSSTDGKNNIEIKIYKGISGDDQEYVDSVIFTHDFDLSKDQRAQKNAEMQSNLFKTMRSSLAENKAELLLITLQYDYSDKNLSQTDLNNISGAISDIERELDISCYVEKIKQ